MRIHRLEVEGFGPFRDRQVVDFDSLSGDGIFLIGGKTGAGKSSILDAVCFAFYGGVPRYEDGDKRLRSDHSSPAEPTRVSLEFSSGDRRWRIERVPTYERLKKNGRGTTKTPAEARLDEWVDGGWVGRAARPVDVGHELGPILGLNQQQFLQVILLAQGRFARFLLARNDERQALLRTLFDSHRFEGYEGALERLRRETADRLTLENRVLLVQLESAERLVADHDPASESPPPGSIEARLERVGRARLQAAHARELSSAWEHTAKEAHTAADSAHAAVVAQGAGQQRRERARVALAQLESRADAVAADRAELTRAQEAEGLRGTIEAARRASAALSRSVVELEHARSNWLAQDQQDADALTLDQRADGLAGEVGGFRAALAAEEGLGRLQREHADAVAVLAAVDTELAALDERRAQLPALEIRVGALIAEAAVKAQARPDAALRVTDARNRVSAANEADSCRLAVTEAQVRAAAAGRDLTRVSGELDVLRERRFRDHAGELAELLTAGEPCPVCGSCEHPAPSPRGDDPVTDERITVAEVAKDAAIAADRATSGQLRSAEQALSDAVARAAGNSVAQAQAELATREAAYRAATVAVEERDRLELERARLGEETATLAEAHADLTTHRAAAGAEIAGLAHRITTAEQAISAARGDHESVAARIAETEQMIAFARALSRALRVAETHRATAAEAIAELADRLDGSSFEDEAQAVVALRDQDERDRLDAGLRRHDAELASQKQTLLELELEVLPEAPVDLPAAEAALEVAADQWRAAVAVHTEAATLAAQLDDAGETATIAHAAIADLAEEADVIDRLAGAVAGRAPNTLKMNLETFVLAAELEEIVAAANIRLDEMSQGRYRLRHTDSRAAHGAASGLGIDVMDAYTGLARPVQSLSGGETFLASLSLALGLAEVVTARAGGIRLDTLFIDEGFGSLDADTLDIAMRTLDELRQGGRVVGVISHVEAMKDQLASRILVEATDQGPSAIRQDVASV